MSGFAAFASICLYQQVLGVANRDVRQETLELGHVITIDVIQHLELEVLRIIYASITISPCARNLTAFSMSSLTRYPMLWCTSL